jgi:hypothetical protein
MHAVGWILIGLLPIVLAQWQPQDAGTKVDFAECPVMERG